MARFGCGPVHWAIVWAATIGAISCGGHPPTPPPIAPATIALYTSVPENAIPAIKEAFEKAHPGLTLAVTRAGTEKLLDRIGREAASDSPGFDVAWLSDFTAAESLADRGLLVRYAPPDPRVIPSMFIDPDGYYSGSRVMCMAICINTASVTTRPASYRQLLEPEFRRRVGVVDPHTSGAAFNCVATLMKSPDYGWEYYKRLYDHGAAIAADNADLLKRIATGELSAGLVLDNQVRDFKRTNPAAPVDFLYPPDGLALVVSPIAVSARSTRPDAARCFADWVLSKEGQALLANQTGTIPTRSDVTTDLSGILTHAKIIAASPSSMNLQKERILAVFDAIFAGKPISEIPGGID